MSAGLTLTRQAPADGVVLELGDTTPSDLHHDLASTWSIREAAVDAVRDLAAGHDLASFLDVLEERGIEAPTHALQSLAVGIARGDVRKAWAFVDALPQLGQGRSPFDAALSLPRLLSAGDATPTIAVHLDRAWFDDVRRDQREAMCQYLATLAQGCDVRIVAGGIEQRRLATEHRADLPRVDEQCNTRGDGPPTAETVAAARDRLEHDGRQVEILREIADAPSETRTFSTLYEEISVSEKTVRSHLITLDDLDLIDKYDALGDGKEADLTPAGREFIDTLDSEIGRQRRLSDCVDETPNPSDNAVLSSAHTGGGTGGGHVRHRLPALHTTEFMSRTETVQAAHTPPEGGVAVVDHPVSPAEDRATGGWSYDSAADRLVVSAEFDNPLQYWVTVAAALTNWRTWEYVLDEDRLERENVDEFITDQPDYLRATRCLGYLADDIEDATAYVEALEDARDDLLEFTGEYHDKKPELSEDEIARIRSDITKQALGLAVNVTHLLDLADVDVAREVRLPEFCRNFDAERVETMAGTIAIGSAIMSRYGHHVAYRHLFEHREDKRRQVLEPTVDAADPDGGLIGSWVLVGDLGNREADLATALEEALANPTDLHEDAPEFGVPIPVEVEHPRRQYAAVVRRMCRERNLRPTREAVSLFQALTATPYDAVDAIARLDTEETPREIRVDEVRYAIAHLDADRLLGDATPTPRAVTAALLRADEPLSRADLAARAGVSTESLRQHLPKLVGLGLATETPEGIRLQLSFHTDDGRRRDVLPRPLTDDLAAPQDLLFDVAVATIDDRERYGDPADPVFGVWLDPPPDGAPDLEGLRETWDWVAWGLPVAGALCDVSPATPSTVRFGAAPDQTPITDPTEVPVH